ncbi:POTE ankyrin domain family member A-like [Passer montanus]|uniref:POTE ankyrin domain family member A-like n=1 Tax=Passer montanus TaxID=9160 RepID=UPI001961EB47|nr:POTE ankyrin domain family member A-like [Passer montanus]
MGLADLHSAAASADLARLRQHWWLNKHRINGYNRDRLTPLHLACINGHADVVQFLVENKCKLNPCDKLDKSPLMKAVEYQHRDCAAILLEHGANHDHRSINGNTALHFAVMVSSKSLVELLLEHGADIDAKNKWGYTPLALAITENREEMVKFLLQKGADVNAQDKVYSIANERIGSSCYEATHVNRLETPTLAQSCHVPKEEAAEKKGNGPAADRNKVSVRSIRVQPYRGDYKEEGAEKKEDKRSLCNPETDPKGRGKVRARERHPAATSTRSCVRSAAVERGKGVLKPAGGAVKKEGTGSPRDSETDSEGEEKVSTAVQLPAANSNRLDAHSAVVECCKGVLKQLRREVKKEDRVLQPAEGEAKQEYNDFPWDSELPTLQGEDLQLKVDSSTQTNSEQDKQPLARQKLDKILKKDSLEGAPLGTVKVNSRKEQKLLLEKLERCKTKLKDLKKSLNKNEYYADSGKNAQKEKVITILRNVQGILVDSFDSSAAAIPQLEERIQRLQMQMARLEATIQQQAKTIEVFETIQQTLTPVSYSEPQSLPFS